MDVQRPLTLDERRLVAFHGLCFLASLDPTLAIALIAATYRFTLGSAPQIKVETA